MMEPRDGILAAAQTVFARHGFRQTAMAMVAAEAGLSRQALYHHFDSKEALFAALVDQLQEVALIAAQEAAMRGGRDVADVVYKIMLAHHRSFLESVASSPFAAELIEESSKQCGSAVAAHTRRFEKELEAAISGVARAGRFDFRPGVGARDLTEMVCVAAKGVKTAYAGEGDVRYAQKLKRMIDMICAGAGSASVKASQRMGTARRMAR
ncbi:MAG: TetR/AcrR family transcriptional regulator [Alphaproteobacteria bacterium]|nr:TetR/AcrR family transcriptional regulator [Alphaproteobacteria bacterium]